MTYLSIAWLLLAMPELWGQGASPAFNQAEWNKAVIQLREGRADQAAEAFKRALGQRPDRNRLAQAGRMLSEAQGLIPAESLYRWGRKVLGQGDLFAIELGSINQSQLKYPEAVSEYLLALKSQPEMAKARFRELALVAGSGKVARLAERQAKEAGDHGRWLVAELWHQAGDSRRAWDHARRIRDRKLLAQAFTRLLEGLAQDRNAAIALTEDYLSTAPADSLALLISLSDMYLEGGQTLKAEGVLALLAGRDHAEAQYRLAWMWLESHGRPDKAEEIVRDRSPNWPPGLKNEGELLSCRCQMAEGRWGEAARRCSLLTEGRDPEMRQRAFFLWGESALAQGIFDQALSHFSQAVRALEDGGLANDALARILLISQAKTDKINNLSLISRAISCHYSLDRGEALRAYGELADSVPGTLAGDLALEEMASLSLRLGGYRQAMSHLARLAETTGDSLTAARAFHQMGVLSWNQGGDPRQAAEKWEQGILRYPNTSWAELMRQALESLKEGNKP